MSNLNKEQQVNDGLGQLTEFIDQLELPTSIVEHPNGNLIHLNRQMFEYLKGDLTQTPYKCSWINSKDLLECPDASDIPTLEGRCFMPRGMDEELVLVFALRLESYNFALLRIYATPALLGNKMIDRTLLRALQFASSSDVVEDDSVSQRKYGLSKVILKDIVGRVISLTKNNQKINNMIAPTAVALHVDPLSLHRLSSGILSELDRISGSAQKLVSYEPSRLNDTPSHIITYTIVISEPQTKSKVSGLGSMLMRLQRLRKQIVDLTSYSIEPIKINSTPTGAVVELEFADVWSRSDLALTANEAPPSDWSLSPREEEIVEMISSAYSNEDIAFALGIKSATVKQHLKSIYRKANAKNKMDLIFSRNISVIALTPEENKS
ncbi:MAG: helix-turn-helix transcriptional regulator [Nitrospinota bacterium]